MFFFYFVLKYILFFFQDSLAELGAVGDANLGESGNKV